jgi:hypothetical protein
MAKQSRAFFRGYERCMEQRLLPGGKLEMPIVPAVVCLVFSIELGLRALAKDEGSEPWGHRLADLFDLLSPELRLRLAGGTGLSWVEFEADLKTATDTFVDWRYVHDKTSSQANLEFLRKFAAAIQTALPPGM